MSSVGDRYLPDIAKCFAGDAVVFSWVDTFKSLDTRLDQSNSYLIKTLISSPKVKHLLAAKTPSFPPPSQQTRTQFETRTAAINVTSSGTTYDINTIKNDTSWLSGEVNLAEDEALRLVVLEWQRQPAERLLSGYSDAELSSLQTALGNQDMSADPTFEQTWSKRSDDVFDTAAHRRQRLLNVYFKERAALLGVSRTLQEFAFVKNDVPAISEDLMQFALELDPTSSTDPGIESIIQLVDSRLRALEAGTSWSSEIHNANDQWIASELDCISILQEILLLRIRGSPEKVPTDSVLHWLQMMTGCEFFTNVQPGPLLPPSQLESLQTMTSLTTLAMLDPAGALQTLGDSTTTIMEAATYFLNSDAAHDLHSILLPVAEACVPQAVPSAFAWALIMDEIKRHAAASKENRESGAVQRAIDQVATYDSATGRRASSGSFQQSVYEEVMSGIMNTSDISDPATYLLRCTVEAGHVFDTIGILSKEDNYSSPVLHAVSLHVLQELITVAVSSLGYTSDSLEAQFSILSTGSASNIGLPDSAYLFIKDDFLMDNIFGVAAGRFPYESLPYLRLCRLLASAPVFDDHGAQYVTFRLRTMNSFTQSAFGPFAYYHTVREDENLNLVALDSAANMFQGTQKRLTARDHTEFASSVLPMDTLGEVISESVPPIIRWQHTYSGLALLGTWLELHYLGQLQTVLSDYESADEVATEIVNLITALLKETLGVLPADLTENDRERLQDELLEEASSNTQSDYSDVANYIFEILEQELQAYRRRPSNLFNISMLIACIDFAAEYSKIRPDQFWAAISKSSLLESYGSDSFLLSIVSGVEVPNQSFAFLESCTKMYHSLIGAVLHQSRFTLPSAKLSKGRKFQPLNLRLHANVLLSITQSLYAAFEAIPGWIFASTQQQSRITASLAASFEKVVLYSNSIEHSKLGLTSTFHLASNNLAQQIRSGSDDISSTSCITRHIFRLEQLESSTTANSGLTGSRTALTALLSLSVALVRLGKLRTEPPSPIDLQLFSALPLLCRSISRSMNLHILHLIGALLETVAKGGPVSLLGHLGSTSAVDFLEILKLNLGDWAETPLKTTTWKLLSELVGRNQQWLAIVILSGSPPEQVLKSGGDQVTKALRGKTFLELSLKLLVKIAELEASVTTNILKFVTRAQMNWSWTNEAMKTNKDFLPAIMSYVCNTYIDPSDDLKMSYHNRIAASISDLSTIHLHHAKARRDTTTLNTIVPLLRWLTEHSIEIGSYKHSLHTNLRKNFASKYVGLELSDFKRTALMETDYGDQYYYDLDFGNQILKSEQQWNRSDRYRDHSFSAEVRRANLNLSVVDSEVKLLNSFLNLCVEHSGYLVQDTEVRPTVVDIIKNALDANTQAYPPEKIFDNVLQIRADMAIALLQRLVEVKPKGSEARALLKHAWDCAQYNNGSFEQAILDNNLTYWRSMLTIVLMTLQFQVDKRYMPPAADSSPAALLHHTEQAIPTMLQIVTVVIGQGFRTVAAALQDQRQSTSAERDIAAATVSHKDVNLIMTIFETILRMTRLPEFISEASQRLIVEGAIQSSLLLYSWSHVLTEPEFDNEPIYAAYSLRFLAGLSSLPPMTEELAVEGVLSRLLSSRMTQKLQSVPDGAKHLDKRPHVQGLYDLWATGLLPLCLNLLHTVGAPVAADVSIFLNQFPNQLNRASVAFIPSQPRPGAADSLTSTVADEATTLALISYVLSSFRSAGASAAVDPSTIQPLVGYDEHKKALSEDISDVINSSPGSLKSRVIATNEKELALSREGKGDGLVNKVVLELRNSLTCLKGEELEDDK